MYNLLFEIKEGVMLPWMVRRKVPSSALPDQVQWV